MVFNFRLAQKLSPFFFFCKRKSFVSGIFPSSPKAVHIYFGSVQSDYSINKLFIDIQPEKRKPTVSFFKKNKGDIPL